MRINQNIMALNAYRSQRYALADSLNEESVRVGVEPSGHLDPLEDRHAPLAGDAVRADALVPPSSWAFDAASAPPVAFDLKAADPADLAYAVVRLQPGSELPEWVDQGPFRSVTRTEFDGSRVVSDRRNDRIVWSGALRAWRRISESRSRRRSIGAAGCRVNASCRSSD